MLSAHLTSSSQLHGNASGRVALHPERRMFCLLGTLARRLGGAMDD